jgi:enolase
MFAIEKLRALEILDSRGRPTVSARCQLKSGFCGTASVPSGASTGKAEALELRDGDPNRYRGLGCRRAVRNVNETLHQALAGRSFESQQELDQAMLKLDGTPNKSALGANAILSVSLAFARAAAHQASRPLYLHLADLLGEARRALPRPTINLFSGGQHAGGQSPIQDVLVVPASAKTIDEALSATSAVYQCAAELTARKYGMRALVADEGGLAPPFPQAQAMFDDAVEAIQNAGFTPGQDVALAVDAASSHFFCNGRYQLDEESLDSAGMIDRLEEWVARYPIVSLEDGLAEDDWEHWPRLRERLAGRCLVVGDDLLCTNPGRIRRAIETRAADTLLLKVNQIGTLTEAMEAWRLARAAGWRVTISARSGETEDDWLADLAVGWRGDQIKIGSITRSERLSKYNRLLAIEAETGWPLAFAIQLL